jgi:type I restriction enzyme S subunit
VTTPPLSICDLIVDCEHKTAPTSTWGYASIRTPNVGRGRLILEGVNRVDEQTYRCWTKRAIPSAGDIIIAREAPIGNVAIIMPSQSVCLGQRTVLVRVNKEIVDPQYLTYFLLGDYVQSYFHSCSIGATVPHLNMKDIRSLPLPTLPSLDAQRRIAGILSAYDDMIEVNTRRIVFMEEIARRLYDEWFVKFQFPGAGATPLTELASDPIPRRWRRVCLGDLVQEVRDAIRALAPAVSTRPPTSEGTGEPQAVVGGGIVAEHITAHWDELLRRDFDRTGTTTYRPCSESCRPIRTPAATSRCRPISGR